MCPVLSALKRGQTLHHQSQLMIRQAAQLMGALHHQTRVAFLSFLERVQTKELMGVHTRIHTHVHFKIQLWGIEELEWFNWFSKWPVFRDE